jgi:hypothetical protein
MSLIATERDAQIMELNMRGFTMEVWDGDSYVIHDGCSLTWCTPEHAWTAAIFCAQQGWKPYGEDLPPQNSDEQIEAAVGHKRQGL